MVDDTAGAFDKDGNEVEIDLELVNAWIDPEAYKYKRSAEYPSIQDQLDMQYWDKINGTNNWEALITELKEKYPKGVR
jgi:hypothetical protein